MTQENSSGLVMLRLFNPINKEDELFFRFDNLPKNNPAFKNKTDQELDYISMSYRFMKLKVGNRFPINSRVEEHKWFLYKDKYGVYYLVLVNTEFFEEIYVFKLIKKLENIVDIYSDTLMAPRSDKGKERLREALGRLTKDFNEQIKPYVFISPDSVQQEIVLKSEESIVIPSNTQQLPSKDSDVVFNKIEQRNKTLAKLQAMILGALVVALILAILEGIMFLKKK